jgi:integrase
VLDVLLAATGLRIGELLGLEIGKHISTDRTTLFIRQKVRQCKVEPYLKTGNAYRDLDLPVVVAEMLKQFIGSRTSGFLFCTRNGKPLSDSDLLERHLHPALERLGVEKAGHHAFRRFRVTWLRKQRCPDDLRHFWLGHPGRSVEDDYDRTREDVEFRKQVVESVGLGFEIPASTSSIVPNVPKLAVEEVEEVAVSC